MKILKINLSNISTFLALTFLIGIGINCSSIAQPMHQQDRQISINMSASELVPADVVLFNININAQGKTSQQAYKLHKDRESLLASLLKKFKIEEKDIRFQPIRINKINNYNNNREEQVSTSQQVSLSFKDFDIYERIQLTLIENNFNSFSGQFSSSKTEEGKTKALESAIKSAQERAQFIAKQSGVNLGYIQTINYSDHQISRPQIAQSDVLMSKSSESSMMDFDQQVVITANISIVFAISGK